jgi:hypothetical protein
VNRLKEERDAPQGKRGETTPQGDRFTDVAGGGPSAIGPSPQGRRRWRPSTEKDDKGATNKPEPQQSSPPTTPQDHSGGVNRRGHNIGA